MAEFAGLGYYAELPGVIFDVQRTGPSTGMPTRNQQGDLLSVAFLSHGDTKHVMLIPGSVTECYEMAQAAFDLAEQLQTPVFVMSDLDLGMNNWMSDGFTYPSISDPSGAFADDLGFLGYPDTYVVDPSGTVVPHYSGNILAPKGRATASLPLALNDKAGKWEVRVRDLLSGQSRVSSLEVSERR